MMTERQPIGRDAPLRRAEPLLTVASLRVAISGASGDMEAVRGISFTLGRGETLGMVGESGSGKTLTALSVIGLLPHRTRKGTVNTTTAIVIAYAGGLS